MKDRIILTEYSLPAGLPERLTLGLVTDLHEHEPKKVLDLLGKCKPDLIMAAGDTFERYGKGEELRKKEEYGLLEWLFHSACLRLDDFLELLSDRSDADRGYAYRFFREAGKIAPVFLSLGNHEWYLLPEDSRVIKETGTKLLDNGDCTVAIKGVNLCIGGLSTVPDLEWLEEYSRKEGYKILLCHHPEFYERYLNKKAVDLVLSGHAHGGQIRILNRGIYSPGQGLLPKYTKGVYEGKLVVSAGCSNTASVPRLGNPCEVVAVHLE